MGEDLGEGRVGRRVGEEEHVPSPSLPPLTLPPLTLTVYAYITVLTQQLMLLICIKFSSCEA